MSTPWCPTPKKILLDVLEYTPTPYPEYAAYISVSLDCNSKHPVTVAGYAKCWGWSAGKVNRFLERINARIEYPASTKYKQNQRGRIVAQTPKGLSNEREKIILLDFNGLPTDTKRSDNESEETTDRLRVTTRNNKKNSSSVGKVSHQHASKEIAARYGLK